MNRKAASAREVDLQIKQAVVTMLSLKLRSGTTPLELKQFATDCFESAIRDYKPAKQGEMVWLYQIARVLRTWHLETRFLTPAGRPRALDLSGRSSLETLILCHFPARLVDLVVSTMRRNGLIRRQKSGQWTPTSRYARTPRPTNELLAHFAEGVSRLAETVGKNTNSRSKTDLLFERAAQVSDLPRAEAKAFKRYVQTQGIAFLTAVDDWLESRSRRTTRMAKNVCNAGVFTFAFIDDDRRSRPTR